MILLCQKCLVGSSGHAAGDPCKTEGCGGTMEESPKWSTLVDTLPEPMTCGRRTDGLTGLDRWEKFKRIDNRVCSYCGSLHPEDMFRLVAESAKAPSDAKYRSVIEIEPSDKDYKIYVHQPGVRNAHEGAIKFYTHHFARNADGGLDIEEKQHAEYGEAVRRTRTRFAAGYPQSRSI